MGSFVNASGGSREEGKERAANDHYPTPPVATYAFLEQCKQLDIDIPNLVHEPAAGRGWMAWELFRNDHVVFAADLHAYEDPLVDIDVGHDFLVGNILDGDYRVPAIITNPPYGRDMAQKFVEHALRQCSFVAVLCRLQFGESGVRLPFFKKTPPSHQFIFSGRFSCSEEMFDRKPLSGMVAYAWWLWDYRAVGGPREVPKHTETTWIDTPAMYYKWHNSMTPAHLEKMHKSIKRSTPEDERSIIDLYSMENQ